MSRNLLSLLLFLAACDGSSSSSPEPVQEGEAAVSVVCIDATAEAPAGAWVCPGSTTVECAGPQAVPVGVLYTTSSVGCDGVTVTSSVEGPFVPGTHQVTVTVSPTQGEAETCRATVVVVDTTPPALTPRTTHLWPPNHKMHSLTPADCVDVVDACDPSVRLFFTSATSDEPVDGKGDGATSGDIALGCDSVQVRSERSGQGDARVYTLGVRAVDASGNTADATCRVIVAHDQGGKEVVDSGPAYQVDAPACP